MKDTSMADLKKLADHKPQKPLTVEQPKNPQVVGGSTKDAELRRILRNMERGR